MAATLEREGHCVSLLDLSSEDFHIDGEFDFVGVTCLTNTYPKTLSILKKVRQKLPDTKIVAGGPHVTFLPEEALDTGLINQVVCGEGDDTICDIVSGKNKQPILEAKPVDLSKLPLPARGLLSFKYDVAGITVNRGCPYTCAFCVRQRLFDVCRLRDPALIKAELKGLQDFDYQYFNLYDNLNISEAHAISVVKAVHDSGIKLPWGAELRADKLTAELARLLSKTGCRAIGVGVESGSERVLKTIHKDQDPKLVAHGIEHAKQAGLIVQAYFVLGLPGETWSTFKGTLAYLKQLKLGEEDKIDFFIATPYPGSDLWTNKDKYGINILHQKWDLWDTEHIVMETRDLNTADIEEMRAQALESLDF